MGFEVILSPSVKVTAEMLSRYDRPGPRYTSYPTAVEFHDGYGELDYRADLKKANAAADVPLAVYSHLPFCEERCNFCGCHVVATRKREVAVPYLESLRREMEIVAGLLPDRRQIAQYHLGGGTPTYLSPEQLNYVVEGFTKHFDFLPNAELAVEVDPRVTTKEHIDLLAAIGFNRISMGVQDFTPVVQRAIGRVQSFEQTNTLAEYAAKKGIPGLNIDLIYGLPYQKVDIFAETLDLSISLKPDRVAVYSFAFVPWIKGNQKRMEQSAFPDREEKFALLGLAREKFVSAGYQSIGIDHFALPDDELSIAQREGRLYRNFMGYTVMPGEDTLGFGISAIGDVRGAFVQNEKKLSRYNAAVGAGALPVQKGFRRSKDDEIRRELIQSLMCNFVVHQAELEDKYDIDFKKYFSSEISLLRDYIEEGLCEVGDDAIRVTQKGELFVRNLAMCFDSYLVEKKKSGKPVFSRTI